MTMQKEQKFLFYPIKIVRDYLNAHTPDRGLLSFHGLGSGKTCSSIAIAEGLKNTKKIFVMTPASLRMNYNEELKNCGDDLYREQYCNLYQQDKPKIMLLHIFFYIS